MPMPLTQPMMLKSSAIVHGDFGVVAIDQGVFSSQGGFNIQDGQQTQRGDKLCMKFQNGSCKFGNSCKYLHISGSGVPFPALTDSDQGVFSNQGGRT
jgi:hypothetical protein